MLKNPLTIESTFAGFAAIYAENNALTIIGGRSARHQFLTLSVANLMDCLRKEKPDLIKVALAQTTAWFFCVGEGIFRDAGGRILAQGMCQKYPAGKCGYCGQNPCVCREAKREGHIPGETTLEQARWSIKEWQKNLASVYGKTNDERGIDRAVARLYGEVAEVGALCNLTDGVNESIFMIKQKNARELTDVLAWIFAVASVLKVDLAEALLMVYGRGCPVCRHESCQCTAFTMRPSQGGLTHRFMPAEDVMHCMEVA